MYLHKFTSSLANSLDEVNPDVFCLLLGDEFSQLVISCIRSPA